MTDDSLAVDILALEDFRATLATRRTEIESAIRKMADHLAGHPAQLGGFHDAVARAAELDQLRARYAARMDRLHAAIVAAQDATSDIIANYRSAERRNTANTTSISAALEGVHVALDGGNAGV